MRVEFESRLALWKRLALSLAGLRCVAGWWDRSSGGLLGEAKKAEERKAAQWKAVKPVEKQVRAPSNLRMPHGCKPLAGRLGG